MRIHAHTIEIIIIAITNRITAEYSRELGEALQKKRVTMACEYRYTCTCYKTEAQECKNDPQKCVKYVQVILNHCGKQY